MNDTPWTQAVRRLIDEMGVSQISEASGVSRGTLYRWIDGHIPSPASIITFARNTGTSPVNSLVLAGYLSPEEVESTSGIDIHTVPTDALLEEVRRRINR